MAAMYRVVCQSCSKPYNAETASECDCLQPVRSLRCPHCAACFCTAGPDALKEFWRHAPAAVWKRRLTPAEAPKEEEQELDPHKPVVLFADDDPIARAIAARVIRSAGLSVVLAENGTEALDLARRYSPELVITDALMPGIDGREVGKTLKAEMPRTKLVIITSVYKDPRYKHEAYRNFGADEYLTKPISPAQLREILRKHLR
jgi:CheY-like chemotaxis protein